MLCEAFIAGAPKHAQGFVFYGVKAGNHRQWVEARRSGLDWYFIDNSYFNATRGTYFRVAKNQLQHNGHGLSDYRRLSQIPGIKILRNPPRGDYTLIIPQSDDHMRYVLDHQDPKKWLRRAIQGAGPGAHIRVRDWNADKSALATSFQDDLMQAKVLITHTSAAAVEAVLAGVPVICDMQCAAWPFSDAVTLGFSIQVSIADRMKWASILADNQWTVDEMKEGLAWQKLNPR